MEFVVLSFLTSDSYAIDYSFFCTASHGLLVSLIILSESIFYSHVHHNQDAITHVVHSQMQNFLDLMNYSCISFSRYNFHLWLISHFRTKHFSSRPLKYEHNPNFTMTQRFQLESYLPYFLNQIIAPLQNLPE